MLNAVFKNAELSISKSFVVTWVFFVMSVKSEMIVLRVCGNCKYGSGNISAEDMRNLERVYIDCLSKLTNLDVLRKQANGLKNESVLCVKERAKKSVFNQACGLWRKK